MSTEVMGPDETVETTGRALAVLAVTTIGTKHRSIGREFLQKVQAILDREPKINSYGINETSYSTEETITLELPGATLRISVNQSKAAF